MASIKILLVEDESIEAMDIKRTLESFQYEVPYIASRGEEAVEKALEIMPDLILMDIVLKGDTDGIEAVSKIKSLNIPVIYLTAHSEESTIERAKTTEPYGYIIKPYDPTELKYAIELAIYKNKMEKTLKESEERNRLLVENAGLGIGYYSPDGKIIMFNKVASSQLNGKPEDFKGKTLFELFDAESASIYMERLERAMNSEESQEYEDHVSLPTAEKWFLSTHTRIKDSKGNVIGIQVISQDISTLKQAEMELSVNQAEMEMQNEELRTAQILTENSRKKYMDLYNFSPIAYFTVNKGFITNLNPAGSSLLGYESTNLLNKAFIRFIAPESKNNFHHLSEKVLKTGQKKKSEVKLIIKDGSPIFAHIEIEQTNPEDKAELQIAAIDITERKKVEKTLQESEGLLRGLFDNMPNGMAVYHVKNDGSEGSDYIIKDFNRTSQEIEGMKREDVIGKSLYDIRPNIDEYGLIPIFKKVWETGEPIHYPSKIYVDEKYANWYENYVFKAPTGEIVAIYNDVTQQKVAAEELRESEAFLDNIIENIPAMIFVKNADNLDFKMVNKAGEDLLGHSLEELVGKNDQDFFPKDEADFFTQKDREVLKNKQLVDIPEETIETKNLGQRILHTKKIPLLDKQGNPQYLLGISEDITEFKKADEERIKSEKRFRYLLDGMNDGVTLTHQGIITYVNSFMTNMLGFKSSEELIGKNLLDVMTPQSKNDAKIEINKIQAQSEDVEPSLEIEFIRTDGIKVTTETSTGSIEFDGKIYGIGIYKDITDKIRVQKALQRSEERYRTLYSTMNEGLAIHELIYDDNQVSIDYKIIDVNPAYEEILGIRKEEVLERKASEVYGTENAPYLDIYSKVVQTGNPENFETYFELLDKYFSISVFSPSKGSFVTVFEDITHRKKSEIKLKEREEQINAIFNTVISGIILVDTEGVIDFANQHMTEMFGFKLQELIGMPYLDLTTDKVRAAAETNMLNLIKGEIDHVFEEREYQRKDGSVFWGNLSKTRILNEDGSLKGLIGVITDISDSKKDSEALKDSLKEKDSLLREIHHRVKNNMQIISSLLNLQMQHEDLDETLNVLKESQGRVKTMAMIHEKLYQSPSFTDINFKEYLERLVFDIFYSYGIKTGTIAAVLDIEDILLNIETAIPLGLIVNELVTNSVKYAFPINEGTISIKLRSQPKENKMELNISDDGIGLPEDLDFKNTDSLGLQLVNSLVDQLEGKIDLDRKKGTEFKITFKELEYKERI